MGQALGFQFHPLPERLVQRLTASDWRLIRNPASRKRRRKSPGLLASLRWNGPWQTSALALPASELIGRITAL
jgi:hypothetical protein